MASWREIDRLRKDPETFRRLAAGLWKLPPDGFTEWERAFLESIAGKTTTIEFTTLQSEKLLEIRDANMIVVAFMGFSIKTLLQGCYEARLDLSEADEQWIVETRERDPERIKRGNVGRLLRCARQLGLIEIEEPEFA